jgi:hypothetical protein
LLGKALAASSPLHIAALLSVPCYYVCELLGGYPVLAMAYGLFLCSLMGLALACFAGFDATLAPRFTLKSILDEAGWGTVVGLVVVHLFVWGWEFIWDDEAWLMLLSFTPLLYLLTVISEPRILWHPATMSFHGSATAYPGGSRRGFYNSW